MSSIWSDCIEVLIDFEWWMIWVRCEEHVQMYDVCCMLSMYIYINKCGQPSTGYYLIFFTNQEVQTTFFIMTNQNDY